MMSARLSAAADKRNLRTTMYCLAEPQNRGIVKWELLGLIRATSVNETNASVVVVQVFFFPLYEVHVQSQRPHYR